MEHSLSFAKVNLVPIPPPAPLPQVGTSWINPGLDQSPDHVMRVRRDAVRRRLDPTALTVAPQGWSDTPGRTAGEVAAVLRAAADAVRAAVRIGREYGTAPEL